MDSTENSEPGERTVYRGEVVIAPFDPERLDTIEEDLDDVVEVKEGERLYVSLHGEEGLEVQKLTKET